MEATAVLYRIKQPDGTMVEQEPIIGRYYCRFETKTRSGDPFDKNPVWYECDGNIGQYEGEGQWCDENGEDINMGYYDIESPWDAYLVLQD